MDAPALMRFRAICPNAICGVTWFTATSVRVEEHTEARIFNARCDKCRHFYEIRQPPDEAGWGRRRAREEERLALPEGKR